MVAQSVKLTAAWTSSEHLGTSTMAHHKGHSVKFDSDKATFQNVPSVLFSSDLTKEQHDRENSVLTFYKKTVPLKSCLRVTLPVLILRASDLNSGEIFVSVKRTSKIHLPFLLKESAPYTESKIGNHKMSLSTNRKLVMLGKSCLYLDISLEALKPLAHHQPWSPT